MRKGREKEKEEEKEEERRRAQNKERKRKMGTRKRAACGQVLFGPVSLSSRHLAC